MYRFPIGVILDSFRTDIDSALDLAVSTGADGFQVYATSGAMSPDALNAEKRKDFRKKANERGLKISALCGDLGCGFSNPDKNPALIEQSKRILDLAKELGTDIVTTHIGVVPENPDSEKYKIMQEACHALAEYADSLNAHFAIETGPEPSLRLKMFLDSLGSTGVAVNLDPANLVMVTNDDPVQAVYHLQKYIVHTHAKDGKHLHDIDPEEVYSHAKPEHHGGPAFVEVPLGTGSVDFPAYLNALEEIGYRGFLTIEREVGPSPEQDIRLAADFLRSLIGDKK